MSRRGHRLRPPTSPEARSGQVLTFAGPGDAPPPSELIELKPVDAAPLILGPAPEPKANIEQPNAAHENGPPPKDK